MANLPFGIYERGFLIVHRLLSAENKKTYKEMAAEIGSIIEIILAHMFLLYKG
jgi:hypothetical protein